MSFCTRVFSGKKKKKYLLEKYNALLTNSTIYEQLGPEIQEFHTDRVLAIRISGDDDDEEFLKAD